MTIDGGALFRFLIGALATWRLAFLVARESGPWDVIARFRRGVGDGSVGRMVRCVKCVGLWSAIPFALFVRGDWWDLIVVWLALAGVTALIDEWTRPPFGWQESQDESGVGPGVEDRNRKGAGEL